MKSNLLLLVFQLDTKVNQDIEITDRAHNSPIPTKKK
jgi:hypothetical protein